MEKSSKLKVAIVHDWILVRKGAEKCLEAFCEMFPNADVYTLFYKKGVSKIVDGRRVKTSFLQKFPFWRLYYRYLYTLMPFAIEKFSFDKYDLVISSSFCVAKGIITGPNTFHVSYVYTPMRYAWDMYEDYFGKTGGMALWKKILILPQVSALRLWDFSSAQRPDYIICISNFVKDRILKYWRRDADLVYPPVDISRFRIGEKKKDYFLMVTSFEPNKRVDLAVRAFTELGYPLKVVGHEGRLFKRIKRIAGLNVEFIEKPSDEELASLYSEARAFVMVGVEDFGIAPLEAISSGTPVIAYARGGALDTVIAINPEGTRCIKNGTKNGIFFYTQDVVSIKKAVRSFLEYDLNHGWDKVGMRRWAKKFAASNFKSKMKKVILEKYEEGKKVVSI